MKDAQLKEIQTKYNKLHEMVLLIGQEIINLKKSKIAQQSEIQRLLKYKEDLEEKNILQLDKIKERKDEIDKLEKEHAQVSKNLITIKEEQKNANDIKSNLIVNISELTEEKQKLDEQIVVKKREFNKVAKDYNDKQNKLSNFIEKAKGLLDTNLIMILVVPALLTIAYLYGVFTDPVIVQK